MTEKESGEQISSMTRNLSSGGVDDSGAEAGLVLGKTAVAGEDWDEGF